MKRTNKYLSLALAIIMALSLCVTSFAADATADISVQGAVANETYKAYKIFDYTSTGNTEDDNFAYTIKEKIEGVANPWFALVRDYKLNETDAEGVFTLTKSATDENVYVVEFDTVNPAHFAKYLSDNRGSIAADATASNGTFEDLPLGYWFVDTSLGSLCSLVNAGTTQVLKEKNSQPTITKTVNKNNTFIGDTVTYTITVKDGKGTDAAITVHDQMEAGLTLNKDFVIKVDNEVVANTNYEITYDVTHDDEKCSFHIVFNADFVKTLADGKDIVITYTAELNPNAEIFNATNDNTAWLTYSEQTSPEQKVTVETYEFNVFKHDKDNKGLANAEFVLKKVVKEEVEVTTENGVTKQEQDVVYYATATSETVAEGDDAGNVIYTITGWNKGNGTTFVSPTTGKFKIKGLEAGTFALEETKAPAGYNLIPEDEVVTISQSVNKQTIDVLNTTGSILPSTGGVGTTMFYVLGSVMMIGAAILLVTKKKMANEQ